MTIRNRLAEILAEHLYDRGANVAEWPEDERALYRRLRGGHYDDYCAALRRLRHEKAADALFADLTLLDDICEYRARQLADAAPDMTIADVGGPCTHDPEEWVGRVEAGDPDASPHCSTATCAGCLVASQGYVQAVTNSPASQLIPFETLQES